MKLGRNCARSLTGLHPFKVEYFLDAFKIKKARHNVMTS